MATDSSSASVIYASARPSSPIARWFRQLAVICRLNVILLVRYWKAALFQAVILPLICVGILFGLGKSAESGNGRENAADDTVTTWTMEGIQQCQPEPLSNACMTLVYTPHNAETTQIMNYFQAQNRIRTNQPLKIESNVWDDMSSVPKDNMGIVPMPSETFVHDYSLAHPDTIQLGVAFTKETPAAGPVHWKYQVYYNTTHANNMSTLPDFKYKKEAGFNRQSFADDPYGQQLPNMIRAIDEALLTFLDPQHQQANLDYDLKSFPTAKSRSGYNNGGHLTAALSNLLALPACITMVLAMLRITRKKESKCKESMMMMGLGPLAYWIAQWLTSWIMAIIQASVVVALGYAFKLEIFVNTNGMVLWLMFVLLTYGMTLLGFVLTTFCQRSGSALAFGFAGVVAVLVAVPMLSSNWQDLYINTSEWSPEDKLGNMVLPPTVSTWIIGLFLPFVHFSRLWANIAKASLGYMDYQTGNYTIPDGFHWSNLTEYHFEYPALQVVLPQPATALSNYIANILIFGILTLYLDQVIPNEHSRSRHVFFFFGSIGRAFRLIRHGGSSGVARAKSADAQRVIPYEGTPPEDEDSDVIEERERAVQCQSTVAIRISNLTKTYSRSGPGVFKNLYLAMCCCFCKTRRRSNKIVNKAVDRLNLITQPNELFALLGQNGAGKSTTMQMLYGVTNPTSGNAFLFDRSIIDDMGEIRADMGVCPQHDVLFNDLTCWEHLQLYGGIKDLSAEALRAAASDIDEKEAIKENQRPTWIRSRLEAVQLWKDRDTMAGRLSGGMKRRLSTIISTIGDPAVLILDEPTTGMDPIHRRHVWTFLAQFKRGRSILLTTHSMEEADALGDKVAIMVSGHLKAIGNTTRLKNKFGSGYRVELALGNFIPNSQDVLGENQEGRPSQRQLEFEMTEAVRAIIPEATLIDQSGGMMIFGIPTQAIQRMADLTSMLERAQAQGHLKQWGIAQTSLEEVFLSLIRSSKDAH
ncbi:ATP-binding cassette sub- A member 1 [Podila epigama]|nr:ATP-binding cassette sub- A member 1 [Podila epigama]